MRRLQTYTYQYVMYFMTITDVKTTVDKRTIVIKTTKKKWSKTEDTIVQVISSFSSSFSLTSTTSFSVRPGFLANSNSVTGVFSTVSVLLWLHLQLIPFRHNTFMTRAVNRLSHLGIGFSSDVWKTLMTMMTKKTAMVPIPRTAAR